MTLCNPMDCSPPGSHIHGTFQARILEWVAISYSRGFSRPRDQTHDSYVSCTGRQILYHCATWEAHVQRFKTLKKSRKRSQKSVEYLEERNRKCIKRGCGRDCWSACIVLLLALTIGYLGVCFKNLKQCTCLISITIKNKTSAQGT